MAHQELIRPYNWDQRNVVLQDRVLYVPDYYNAYDKYQLPLWAAPELFGNSNPVKVEFCSGNGAWIAAKAEEFPQYNWVGVELKFGRVRKIWSAMQRRSLTNFLLVCGEGYRVVKHYFPTNTIDEVFINFPDPWPKKRHWKHRIIHKPFVQEVARCLVPKGKMTIVTDDVGYSDVILKTMLSTETFMPAFEQPHYVCDLPGYGSSYFEELWRLKGREIRYHTFTGAV